MKKGLLCLLFFSLSARGEYPRAPRTSPPAPRGPAAPRAAPYAPRAPASATASNLAAEPAPTLALGLRAGANGSFARVAGDDSSNGFGYSVTVPFYVPLPPLFRLTFAPGFQSLSLTRTVDGTGQIIDPNPAEFTQTIRFLSAAASFGYNIARTGGQGGVLGSATFWIEGGAEFLYPISASQTDNFGGSESFSSNSRVLFAMLGVSGEYRLDARVGCGGTLQANYNVLSGSGTQLLSARFSLDVVFHL